MKAWVLGVTVAMFSVLAVDVARPANAESGLKPFVGETAAEFAARKKGLTRPPQPEAGTVVIAADRSGHFTTHARIGDIDVNLVIDTGASVVALTGGDARRLGLTPDPSRFIAKISTANGVVRAAPVVLDAISIGDVTVRQVEAVVMPDNGLTVSLLGMSFLSRLARYEVRGNTLVLNR
ncbi:MAG: retropepsin-like aspartic protease family protein [Xanthobacteraceae bacterium]